jgi:hypothetical protein
MTETKRGRAVVAHITEVAVLWLQADSSLELGRNQPWCMVFDATVGNTERGRQRCLPGTPLGQAGSGGAGHQPAISFAALGRRGGPLVISLLQEWAKRNRRVIAELNEVLAGLEDQLGGMASTSILNSGGGGEFWTGGRQGLVFIGENVRAGSWQGSPSNLQLNRGSVPDFEAD